jgi:hypothetical protein
MQEKLIKSVSFDQQEILYNIVQMHNDGKPYDCDMTYSKGIFYKPRKDGKFEIDEPLYKFDVSPETEDTVKIDAWGKLPLEDNAIESIVIDLPFIISPRDCASIMNDNEGSNLIFKRFSSYYPVKELLLSYKHWIEESYRVLKDNGICVFKCQNTITGGKMLPSEQWSWLCASAAGYDILDQYTLLAKSRMTSGKVKKQEHARRFTSTFFVFKKSDKKKIKLFDALNEEGMTDDFMKSIVSSFTSAKKIKE